MTKVVCLSNPVVKALVRSPHYLYSLEQFLVDLKSGCKIFANCRKSQQNGSIVNALAFAEKLDGKKQKTLGGQ